MDEIQHHYKIIISILLSVCLFTVPAFGVSEDVSVSVVLVDVVINADSSISSIGFTVNGMEYRSPLSVVSGGEILITLNRLPRGKQLQPVVEGNAAQELSSSSVRLYDISGERVVVYLTLVGGSSPSIYPSLPETPTNPETPPTVNPTLPDTPGADTPGSDEPGSDEPGLDEPGADGPFVPILPPAGSVYNLAGFIPLAAGFLLLFLVFFWRRKVYRILKSHAKKHGEKPEKEHLKEIADAIIKLVRDEGRYPEWKKNSDVAKRLSADIVSVLDEMNYARAVPRGALVAEILKAARGRINRHRL